MSNDVNPYQSPQALAADVLGEEEPDASSAAAGEFQPPGVWGLFASLGLGISALVALLSFILECRLLLLYAGGEALDALDFEAEGIAIDGTNRLNIALNLIRMPTAVAFITWMYKAHRNLPSLGHAKLDSYGVWVVLCWFVPILNWFAPYQVMREIYQRSRPKPPVGESSPSMALVGWWWGLWLVMLFTSVAGNFLGRNIETDGQADLATRCNLVNLVATIVTAILAIWIIQRINRFQKATRLHP